MKFLKVYNKIIFIATFFITFTISIKSSSISIANHPNSVIKSTTDVIREFYIENKIKFEIIIYGERTNHINDVIGGITKELSNEVTVTIMHIKDIKIWNHRLSKSAVIFTKSADNLKKLHEISNHDKLDTRKLTNPVHKHLKFTIYIEDIQTHQQLHDTLLTFNRPQNFKTLNLQFFEFFITNSAHFVNLTANLLFSEDNCDVFKPKLLNFYNKTSQKWHKKLKNFNHYENFHGCMLNFIMPMGHLVYSEDLRNIFEEAVAYTAEKLTEIVVTKNIKFRGLAIELVKLMAMHANFTFHYAIFELAGDNSRIHAFETRNFKSNKSAILLRGCANDMIHISQHWSEPYGTVEIYYLVTLNDLYTNYEKLTMPFDETTWVLLTLTFGFTFGIILGLHRCPEWVRSVVFGAGEGFLMIFLGVEN
jgi:hypothetical protein